MSIILGSARIDENGNTTGGKPGDQTKKEVSLQPFYMHSKGWYVLRPKKIEHATKIAKAMEDACANNNIGYDQSNRAAVDMVKKYGSLKNIKEKTETDCSNLVRACILEATNVDVGYFYTGTEVDVLEKSGLFLPKKVVTSEKDVMNGDVLVTKTTGHTVVVVSGNPRTETTKTTSTNTKGKVTAFSLNVRTGAGTEFSAYKILRKDTVVTIHETLKSKKGSDWYKIKHDGEYGYVSAKYIKKV